MVTRRAFVALLGAGLAGCSSGPPASNDHSTTAASRSPTTDAGLEPGESYTTDGGEVVVADPAVRNSIVSRSVAGSSTHPDVGAHKGAQFLVVRLSGAPAEEFAVEADGQAIDGNRYEPIEPDAGLTAFQVTVIEADTAAVVWTGGDEPVRWELPDPVVDAIGKLPKFELREFTMSDSVSPGEPIETTLTVANVGERDGRFLAELGAVVMSDVGEVWFDVPQGETVTAEFSLTPSIYTPMDGSGDELTVVCDWGSDRAERTVKVVEETES
ncbi:MAG: hypothetical protein V5A38_04255 [Halolamina sp.]|uniref:hypothetical protein n=1 Tax=Halolamina sp. TaxID=1940283 RepID=UPI002FC308CC